MYYRNYPINDFHNFEILEQLFETKFVHTSRLSTLKIDNHIAKGELLCARHINGIITFNLNLIFYKTITIPVNSSKYDTIQFIYALQGTIKHYFDKKNVTKTIKASYPAIVVNKTTVVSFLKFEKNLKYNLNITSLRRKVYTKIFKKNYGAFAIKALKFVNDLNASHEKILLGKHNLKLAKHIKYYFEFLKFHDNEELLSTEANIYKVLSSHFQGVLIDDIEKNTNELNFSELKRASDLGDYIKKNPDTQYSLELLTSMSSLTAAKLQKGFKTLYSRTVSDFIKHIRLQKGEHLMVTTDLNISEIVYSIGFYSRSYFSKIFRQEFGCSPRVYKKQIKEESKPLHKKDK